MYFYVSYSLPKEEKRVRGTISGSTRSTRPSQLLPFFFARNNANDGVDDITT
jgi:hypothetical protein